MASNIKRIKKNLLEIAFLVSIIILAACFRFIGSNWDNGAHLHPDERYMTMVAVAIEWPKDLKEYLDPVSSPLSPANNNYGNYIYGTFPLFFVKYIADSIDMGDYTNLTIVGRKLSAVVDIGSLLLVYFIGNNIYRKRFGLLAALLYAVTVFQIQQSHFFTTDNYETFFILATFSLLIIFLRTKSPLTSSFLSVAIGITMGLALSSKISAVVFGAVIGLAIGMKFLTQFQKVSHIRNILYSFDFALLIGMTIFIVFRLTQPYIFASSNWFDLTLNPEFKNALDFQRLAIEGKVMFPPQWNWMGRTRYLYSFKNVVFWGVGLPISIATFAGLSFYLREIYLYLKTHYHFKQLLTPLTSPMLLAFAWIVGDYLYRGGNFVQTFRYLLAIVPFMVLFSAFGITVLREFSKILFYIGLAFVFIPALLWAIAFTSIYTRPTTRVVASDWIYDNVPSNKIIANEHWDDAIPFKTVVAPPFRFANTVELEVYAPDNETKIPYLYEKLSKTDYIFVTSDRARGNLGRLPEDFPVMVEYYKALDEGTLGFTKEKEVTSYPEIFGIEINDSSAEETFWVYDHPTVRIYRKDRDLSEQEFRCVLEGGKYLENKRCVK